ncbi:MAG: DUF2231 domain-containing protein [Thermomonas sp.]
MSHPLHPALVHFPIAGWSLATFADVASLRLGEPAWRFAAALMAVGCAAALATMAAGLWEFTKLRDGNPALPVANRHMLFALAAFCSYATSLLLRWSNGGLHAPAMPALAASILGFILLGITGWLGGQLVYAHGVGVARGGGSPQ